MIKIGDVAREAGVSIATVSNAIHHPEKLTDETLFKVNKAIEKLNYIPNNLASGMRTSRTKILGVIAEDVSAFSSGDIIDGITEYCDSNNYTIILCNLRVNRKVNHEINFLYSELEASEEFKKNIIDSLNTLNSSCVSGLIYLGTHPRDISTILPPTEIPKAYVYAYTSRAEDICVNYDDQQGAELAVTNLIRAGHTKIGMLCGSFDSIPAYKRMLGYQNVLMKNNIRYIPEYVKSGNWHYEDGYNGCIELLSMKDRPTAIFSMSDLMAFGAINAAMDNGFRVPDDIAIHGFDNLEFSEFFRPALSTIDLSLRELGVNVARSLIQKINGESISEKKIQIPCTLINRDTV